MNHREQPATGGLWNHCMPAGGRDGVFFSNSVVSFLWAKGVCLVPRLFLGLSQCSADSLANQLDSRRLCRQLWRLAREACLVCHYYDGLRTDLN